MTKRIEEFTRYGKRHIFFDLSDFCSNDEFRQMAAAAKPVIKKYKKNTVYTIVNVEGIRFDTETKEILADWMRHNAPYVKHCIAIGMDGIKRIMLDSLMTLCERSNVDVASTRDQAIEMLKQREWEKWDRWGGVVGG